MAIDPRTNFNQFALPLGRDAAATKAVARRTDPETSRAAAASITPATMRTSQRVVLNALRLIGPSTDEVLLSAVADMMTAAGLKPMSPSGCRSRRSELVDAGLVRDSGQRAELASGRKAIVWEVTP
jgi:hypothetical protein